MKYAKAKPTGLIVILAIFLFTFGIIIVASGNSISGVINDVTKTETVNKIECTIDINSKFGADVNFNKEPTCTYLEKNIPSYKCFTFSISPLMFAKSGKISIRDNQKEIGSTEYKVSSFDLYGSNLYSVKGCTNDEKVDVVLLNNNNAQIDSKEVIIK